MQREGKGWVLQRFARMSDGVYFLVNKRFLRTEERNYGTLPTNMPNNLDFSSGSSVSSDQSATPQFARAEYAQGSRPCGICGAPIGIRSYVVDSVLACEKCAERKRTGSSNDSHAAFVQAVIFGIGAALVGLSFYAGFTIVTHFYIGYVALAVGWLVAKAMMAGSKGVGGPRYQITAVILTYAAISLASIPILITRVMQSGRSDIDWSSLVGRLALWGIASPFLQLRRGVSGVIGLVILFVGLRIAYRMTKGTRQ